MATKLSLNKGIGFIGISCQIQGSNRVTKEKIRLIDPEGSLTEVKKALQLKENEHLLSILDFKVLHGNELCIDTPLGENNLRDFMHWKILDFPTFMDISYQVINYADMKSEF